jgi:hypothetical protein
VHRRTTKQVPAWQLRPGDTIDTLNGPDEVTRVARPNKGEFQSDIVYIETASGQKLERDPNHVFTSTTYG